MAEAQPKLKIQWVKTDSVIPYARNPRKKGAVEKVAASIAEFGWRQPISVDADRVIIAGHTRLAAAKRLGLKKVPIEVADHLTPEQVKAYRLADNRSAQDAEWDEELLPLELGELDRAGFDLGTTGFTPGEVGKYLAEDLGEAGKESGGAGAGYGEGFEYRVVIDCDSEEHQAEVIERLEGEGLRCRALIS